MEKQIIRIKHEGYIYQAESTYQAGEGGITEVKRLGTFEKILFVCAPAQTGESLGWEIWHGGLYLTIDHGTGSHSWLILAAGQDTIQVYGM